MSSPSAQPAPVLLLSQPGPRGTRWLRWLVVLSWVGWAMAVGSLCVQQRVGLYYAVTWLWLPAGLAGAAASAAALLCGVWRAWIGPRRRRMLAGAMIGFLPLVTWGAFAAVLKSNRAPRVAHRIAHLAGTSLVRLTAEWRYPHRLETERLIMYYHEEVTDPRGDVAAMESHLSFRDMEKAFWQEMESASEVRGMGSHYAIDF